MSRRFWSAGLVIVALCFAVAAPVWAHTEIGGPGTDNLQGHDAHGDNLNGAGGCDTVDGNGSPDSLFGGGGGCDVVRGGSGADDNVNVWDDSTNGDQAHGGANLGDACFIDLLDTYFTDCERVTVG